MNLKFTLLCIISSIGLIQSAQIYDVSGRKYYISHPAKASYYGALRHCNSQGMHLLDIINDAENNRVNAILKAFQIQNNVADVEFWISGTDLGSEGSYYWASNGHPLHFTFWAPHQPDNHYKSNRNLYENCLSIENSLLWNDSVCEDEKYFICRDTFDVPIFAANRCPATV